MARPLSLIVEAVRIGPAIRTLASAMLLLAAFCWGIGNVANKTVLEHLDPFVVVGLRCALAALVFLPFALRDLMRPADPGWWLSVLRVAGLFSLGLSTQQIAYQWTSVTNASFLINTSTVMTPLMAWVLLRLRPGPIIACAAPLTLAGACLMAGAGLDLAAYNRGDLMCLLSALFYSAWIIALAQHAAAHGRALATALIQFAAAALMILPFGLVVTPPDTRAVVEALPELLLLGLVSTGLAFGLMTWAQAHVSASTAAVLTSAEGVFGAIAAYLFLAERPTSLALLGAALILLGILLVALADRSPAPFCAKPMFRSIRLQPTGSVPRGGIPRPVSSRDVRDPMVHLAKDL